MFWTRWIGEIAGTVPQAALALCVTASTVPAASSPYAPGSIAPRPDQATLDRALTRFYGQWKSVYLREGCGEGRVLVRTDGDGKPTYGGSAETTITVSEAHGYGMLATVMMADFDDDAHRLFDGMVRFFHDHPARSDPGLMAWNQVADCTDAGEDVRGTSSATDGDLDIAYAMLLAERRWGNDGTFHYGAEARHMLAAILAHEVDLPGNMLLIGDWAKTGDGATYAATTRSSDFMQSHFAAFAERTGDRRWLDLRDAIYGVMATVGEKYSPRTGLMPDFIVGLPDQPKPAPSGFLEGDYDGAYSWNAARYPWRVGLDFLLTGDERAHKALRPLNAWARQTTEGRPERFADTYRLNGKPAPDAGHDQMAFISMLTVSAMIDSENQDWLDALWAAMESRPLAEEDYFGNTLKLMAMIAVTGHWAKP
ncbi:glycosyl hydrolase family 8 [Ciceribacter lividus]|uniref:Glucanase n=1 Tax=Ciceribacter lividus TaxID=1197950 RepID=A0A6I7HQI4_9HYPH|nr:glycosyl hydrolase family 8 [Ciceribacter lividus]RCW24884.1 glycosyl hydrolase family 8 [Ciceribacter lividus]